jgi:[protein-PII] uridylyltransferase
MGSGGRLVPGLNSAIRGGCPKTERPPGLRAIAMNQPTLPQSPLGTLSPNLAGEVKDYLKRHTEAVGELIQSGQAEAGTTASEQWARIFDGLLSSLFHAVRGKLGDDSTWDSLALAAVGSYGRGGFGYRSDLDVRILCKVPKKAAKVAEALLYPLWDAGVQVGHQVITVGETISLAKKDLATATTLLDWRHLAGNTALSDALQAQAFQSIFAPNKVQAFLDVLEKQSIERWLRFGDSVYLLEPDIKSGQGGTRDLDIVHWTALSRWRVRSLKALVNIGVLLPKEYEQLEEAREFLIRMRNVLHFNSKRRTDRLGFEQQELVAAKMGYGTGGPGCEKLMSDYYRHARNIAAGRETLLYRAAPPPKRKKEKRLGNGLVLEGDAVGLEDPGRLHAEPALALRMYWEAAHRDLPVLRSSRDAISRATQSEEFCEAMRRSEEAARLFRRLVRLVRVVRFKQNSILTELHDIGILLAMVPEFSPVVGRVHHDIYHVYTVDAHSIAAVDRMRALARGELTREHPLASRIAAELARPQVTFMAALLHDIGKDTGGRQHSERGFDLTRPILERLGVAEHDIVEIQHLVLMHLRMYHVASRRDLDDPKTISDFSADVHGPEGLKELYLLTVCDVATTSPTALTSWKDRMLEELYRRSLQNLEGQASRRGERAQGLRDSALALCPAAGERAFLEHFLSAVPERYLYSTEPPTLVGHSRFARQSQTKRFMVGILAKDDPYAEIGFVTDDKPGTLAMITAALAANRIKVISAQLYSWQDQHGRRRTLDLFWVRSGESPVAVERALSRVETDLEKLLGGEISAHELLASREGSTFSERPSPGVQTSVMVDNRSATDHTIVEVIAQDRPGLLYRLAKTIAAQGLQVGLAKINTEGHAVADVFYVADQDGRKISGETQLDELRLRLEEVVQPAPP